MTQNNEKSNTTDMKLTNTRWKRDTNSTNPFKNEKYTAENTHNTHKPQQNSRWKRDETDTDKSSSNRFNKSYNSNSRGAYRPPGQRNERRGRERFYGRYNREVKKKPKKIPFKFEEGNFPGLVSSKPLDNTVTVSNIPVGNWHAAAMKAVNLPEQLCKKKNVERNHIPKHSLDINEDIDWSDEEQLPNPVNDIDQYDEQEYESGPDNTDDMIF